MAVLRSKSQNQAVILSGEDNPLTTHIAWATQPTTLSGSPVLHHNELQKLLKK
jgi:hypothetical protein